MNMFIPRVALLEFKKLARAFFSLKPSHNPPNVELHPNGQETQLVMRRGDAVIALCLDSAVPAQPMSLPFSILDIGNRKGDVQVQVSGDGTDTVELAWTDQDVPQRASYVTDLPPEPPVAPELSPVDARLITALSDATVVTDPDSKRYALQCIQLDGERGTVVATDGRQLLRHRGFTFPWPEQAILLPGNRVFTAPELRRQREVSCALAENILVFAAGPWRFWLPLETESRFPRVESIIPDVAEATNRICLDLFDLDFLARNLRYLPGAKQNFSPVTVDLNGHVDFAGDRSDEDALPKRLRLNRSTHLGSDKRVLVDRTYLQRAAKLGLRVWFVFDGGRPLLCRNNEITYLWQPLHREPEDEVARDPSEVLVESLPAVMRKPQQATA